MNCLHCNTTIEHHERFCGGCGMLVKAAPSVAAPTGKSDHLLGRVLDAKYELLACLGAGGMGTVYRARRLHIGDEVAVKVLHQNYTAEADMVERFRREARACAALRHANVVTIYDYSETRADALAYIVMELVPGVSLGQWLKGGNRLPLHRAVALMRHICAGVGAAHRRQIIHRDLKPDNVIVVPPSSDSETETVKVVDFGIAKLRDLAATQALTEAGMVIGTPFYMSPEQCRGDALDARSDVYSLGVMFYEMIAGMRPFNAPTPTGVIAKQLTAAPPPLHPTLKIPASVEAVLRRALAKDPQARPADAAALAQALVQAMTTTAPPVVNRAPVNAPSRNGGKALVATLAVLCLLAVAGAVVGALLVRRAVLPTQAVRQPQQPAASPTPSRSPQSLSAPLILGRNPKANTGLAQARPSVAVVSNVALRATRTTPPPPPLGPSKKSLKAEEGFNDFFATVPAQEHAPVAKPMRRAPVSDKSEPMPPEIRRLMQQMIQSGIPTRSADGKVTTIYVTRP